MTPQRVPGWQVLIGINTYMDNIAHPPLQCCVRDAIGLYVLLTHPHYGTCAPERVCLLLDGTEAEVQAFAQTAQFPPQPKPEVKDRGLRAEDWGKASS